MDLVWPRRLVAALRIGRWTIAADAGGCNHPIPTSTSAAPSGRIFARVFSAFSGRRRTGKSRWALPGCTKARAGLAEGRGPATAPAVRRRIGPGRSCRPRSASAPLFVQRDLDLVGFLRPADLSQFGSRSAGPHRPAKGSNVRPAGLDGVGGRPAPSSSIRWWIGVGLISRSTTKSSSRLQVQGSGRFACAPRRPAPSRRFQTGADLIDANHVAEGVRHAHLVQTSAQAGIASTALKSCSPSADRLARA